LDRKVGSHSQRGGRIEAEEENGKGRKEGRIKIRRY